MQAKPSFDAFSAKRPAKARKSSVSSTFPLIGRPIATNSRVKQDEKYRKDMYLAFVNNALQQKTNGITDSFDELVNQFNPKRAQTDGAPQLAQLRLWILALSHVVSRLERTHAVLVEAVVSMPWTTLDTATVKSYTVFIGMLLSARPEYLSLVLGKIAQGFTHQYGLQTLDAGLPEGSSSPLTRRVVYDRLHYLLRHLLSLIPTLPSTLQPLLVRHFPHKRQNQVAQSTYIRNLLRVSSYCPELSDKILATIIDRAIQIDVEIQVELEELDEDEDAADGDVFELDPFDTLLGQEAESDSEDEDDNEGDDFSDLSSDGDDFDEAPVPEFPTNVKHIQDMAKKLDAILTLIFEHFHRTFASVSSASSGTSRAPSPPDLPPLPPLTPMSADLATPIDFFSMPMSDFPYPTSPSIQAPISTSLPMPTTPLSQTSPPSQPPPNPQTKSCLRTQFHALLSIFDRTILHTFKSRYTQFLIFFYTSLDPEFADVFQGMLVDRALFQDPLNGGAGGTPLVTRAAAASYIGSFVSRAKFVDQDGARRVVGVLCEFLRVHLEGVEDAVRMGMPAVGGTQNAVFYAVVQAVFLIFCFRWRDLLEEEEEGEELVVSSSGKGGKKWMPELGVLQRAVTSVLNPLKVCSANVVAQFARVARATDFIYCYTILESNKRSEYGTSSDTRSNGCHSNLIHPSIFGEPVNAELNTFFPFDPYRLPRSNAYIQGVYRDWSSVSIDDEDEDDDSSDGDEDEDSDEDSDREDKEDLTSSGYLSIPRSSFEKTRDDGGLGESLGAMSISPARHGAPVVMRAVVGA
ncbi:RNA polymerase I-specific transcription initiation factor RRN3 [Crucibulum laeve]|uniref:RNA polymerase I-specific transcription initiation factor RRN3 n=1 Tax=Crucibulum laeve TaxID=68775 RepID=A0A5C3MGK1_9AGAR|nr:RNA polymerase I-specific transcription initiation factor RRN3 [Crucibulum laeve]